MVRASCLTLPVVVVILFNIKWSADDEWGEGIIDTIEAVTLGSKGVYPFLIGTLVIVIHTDNADLQIIN